jgi:hypothetical protein
MNLDQLDQLLARFTAAEQAISANLVELEGHPTTKLLQSAGLTGTTAGRVGPALTALGGVWAQFSAFRELLQRAREVRGRGRRLDQGELAELERLLVGPSITLTGEQVPLAERDLTGEGQVTWRVSPPELVDRMTTTFDRARDEIFTADRLWRDLLPRVERARNQLVDLERTAAPLGVAQQVGLPGLTSEVERLGTLVVSDPMGVGDEFDRRVEPALAACANAVSDLARAHASLVPDLARAATLVDEVARLVGDGAAALEQTRAKVLHPGGLLEPLSPATLTDPRRGLRPWLDRLRAIVGEGNWQAGRRGLDQWLRAATETRNVAAAVLEANRAPLRQRDELRGRLAAYSAKAAALGLAERRDVEALRDAADDALSVAPADLTAAADLVSRYGAALRGNGSPLSGELGHSGGADEASRRRQEGVR